MNTHVEKTQENKPQSVSRGASKVESNGELSQFVDNRPEMVAQRKLQEMVNNSPQVMQLKVYQAMADNRSPQESPIQKKENATGLPDNLKSGMENLSGFSLDDVKVHRNSDKPAQLQAHAYAQGTDIHLASGQEKHLPHEAWHVVQQKQGRVKPTMQMKGKVNVNDDAGLEREADVMGAKALNTGVSNTSESQSLGYINRSGIAQRVLTDSSKATLVKFIGAPKFKILAKPEYATALGQIKVMSKSQLKDLKKMEITVFTEKISHLNEGGGGGADRWEVIGFLGQVLELGVALSADIETIAEPIAETTAGMIAGTIGGVISAVLDIKGGLESMQKGKIAEGGFSVVSGLSGGLSAIPGAPDLLGTVSAAAKFCSGGAQLVNTRSNFASLKSLKGDVGGNQLMGKAIDVLVAKNSYYDASKTMGLAAADGLTSMIGGLPKYLLTGASKAYEPIAEKLYSYAGSSAKESKEFTTASEKSAFSLAVKNTGGMNDRFALLGRLYKIAKLTDDDLAKVMTEAGNTLPTSQKKSFQNKCK
jgi:hypothetical protein